MSRLSAPAAAGSTWPSRTLRALTHLAGLPGVRELRHQTPQNLTESLSSCAPSAARTRATARSQCQGLWQLKSEGWHALHLDGRRERRTVLPTVPPPSAIAVPVFFFLGAIDPCGAVLLPPLEWSSILPLVTTVLIMPKGVKPPGSRRIGVIGALVLILPAGRDRTAASDAPELLRPCAASAARTRARARCQCLGPWQLKREGWHALQPAP